MLRGSTRLCKSAPTAQTDRPSEQPSRRRQQQRGYIVEGYCFLNRSPLAEVTFLGTRAKVCVIESSNSCPTRRPVINVTSSGRLPNLAHLGSTRHSWWSVCSLVILRDHPPQGATIDRNTQWSGSITKLIPPGATAESQHAPRTEQMRAGICTKSIEQVLFGTRSTCARHNHLSHFCGMYKYDRGTHCMHCRVWLCLLPLKQGVSFRLAPAPTCQNR